MKKILALLLALICTPTAAQNYLRDDGTFHSVVEGTTSGQLLYNNSGLLGGINQSAVPLTIGTTPVSGGTTLGVLYNNAGLLGNTNSVASSVLTTNGSSLPAFSTSLPSGVLGPTTTALGNIAFWDVTLTGTKLGSAPTYQTANPANSSIYSVIANPANGYTTIYNGMQFSQGTPIPASEQFGANNVGVQQAIVGTLDVATGDTAGNAGYGVIGYGKTNSATTGAVGIGGVGSLNIASGNIWGANFSVGNTTNRTLATGVDIGAMYAAELNVTVDLKTGAVEPAYSNLFGIYLIGSGTGVTNKGSGISIDRLSITTGSKWLQAFESRAGAAVDALSIGASAASGTSLDSQFITFRGVGSGGSAVTAQTKMDFNGNMLVRSALNAGVVLGDSVTNFLTTVPTGTGSKIVFNQVATAGAIVTSSAGAISAAGCSNGQFLLGVTSNPAACATMSGDATVTNAGVLTLASTITASGPIGSATVAPIITYDAKGRLTAVSSATITPAVGSITGLGTGVATALAANVGSAGAPVTFNGALGSPSSVGTMPAQTLGGTIAGGGNQINNVVIGATTPLAGTFTTLATSAPVTYTGTSVTIGATDTNVIFNPSGGFTVTMPAAASFPGRILNFKVIAAQTVSSAASNIVPVGSATPGTAIFGGASGKWGVFVSDASNWVEMSSN